MATNELVKASLNSFSRKSCPKHFQTSYISFMTSVVGFEFLEVPRSSSAAKANIPLNSSGLVHVVKTFENFISEFNFY